MFLPIKLVIVVQKTSLTFFIVWSQNTETFIKISFVIHKRKSFKCELNLRLISSSGKPLTSLFWKYIFLDILLRQVSERWFSPSHHVLTETLPVHNHNGGLFLDPLHSWVALLHHLNWNVTNTNFSCHICLHSRHERTSMTHLRGGKLGEYRRVTDEHVFHCRIFWQHFASLKRWVEEQVVQTIWTL